MKCFALHVFILILSSCVIINAQTWDHHTIWIFETDEYGPPVYDNYLIYRVESDTIIDESTFFKIAAAQIIPAVSPENFVFQFRVYLSYENSRVYLFDTMDAKKHLIYDFNLDLGASYLAYCDLNREYFTVNIDSVSYLEKNGITRKVQYVSSENISSCYLQGQIIEGMGFVENLLPRYTHVDPPPGGYIVCFNDVSFTFPGDKECSLLLRTRSVLRDHIKTYPNPVYGNTLFIEGFENIPFVITDAQGKMIAGGVSVGNTIPIDRIAQGIYFISLQGDKAVLTSMFIKMD